ncbi:MAG TPA: PH domain-containing protein, partial [Streptosporangiaceae bacterium]
GAVSWPRWQRPPAGAGGGLGVRRRGLACEDYSGETRGFAALFPLAGGMLVRPPSQQWSPAVSSQQQSPPPQPSVQPSPARPSTPPRARDREVFRSPGALVLSGAWLLVAAMILADLAVQGRDRAAVTTAVLVLVITGVVYACAWRPRIVADSEGVTVANPLRDYRVPWGAVAKVDVVNAVRVHCAPSDGTPGGAATSGAAAPGEAKPGGKVVYSWAVQSSPRSSMRASRRAQRAGRGPGVGASGARGYGQPPAEAQDLLSRSPAEFTAAQLEERAERARRAGAAGGQHVARWAWAPIAAMVAPAVALIFVAAV